MSRKESGMTDTGFNFQLRRPPSTVVVGKKDSTGSSRQALSSTTGLIQDRIGGVQGTVGLGWRPRKEATVAQLRPKAGRSGVRWGILRGLPSKVQVDTIQSFNFQLIFWGSKIEILLNKVHY